MRENDYRDRDDGRNQHAEDDRLLQHLLGAVAIIRTHIARDQCDGAGADCGDSGAHGAEDLRREADRADGIRAEPSHHQHRGESENRIEAERQDHRPGERPHLEADPLDRWQGHRDPALRTDFGDRFQKLGHDSDQLRQHEAR